MFDLKMNTQSNFQQVLHFVSQDNLYCVALNRIERVLLLVDLKPIPLAPNFVVGLMSLQGQSVVVIDLAQRLGLNDEEPYSLNTPILLCESQSGKMMGLVVSEVVGVERLNGNGVQLCPVFDEPSSPFRGVINSEYGQSLQLDVDKVLDVQIMNENSGLELNKTSVNLADMKL